MGFVKVLVIKMLLPNNRIVERDDVIDEKLIPDVERLKKEGYVAKATKSDIEAAKAKEKSDIKNLEDPANPVEKTEDSKTGTEKDS